MWPEHVAPNFAPFVERWGDPIPLIWERETYDEWVAWLPQRFLTRSSDGKETVWRIEHGSSYKPIAGKEEEERALTREPSQASSSPFGAPYGQLHADWRQFPNGVSLVRPSPLNVTIDGRRVEFEARYVFPCLLYAHKVTSDDERVDVERVCGPIGAASSFEWLRWNDARDCSRWPCHVKVTPKGVDVSDADESLLEPSVPTQADIDVERSRRGGSQRIRDYKSFTRDLCQSKDLLSRMRGDAFAYAFLGIIEQRVIRYSDGTELTFGGEDGPGDVVASLRPFKEYFRSFAPLSGKACTPETFGEISALLKECGYTVE